VLVTHEITRAPYTAEEITATKLSCVWERLSFPPLPVSCCHGGHRPKQCTAAVDLQPPSSGPWSLIVY
jgi:hypothetical protein